MMNLSKYYYILGIAIGICITLIFSMIIGKQTIIQTNENTVKIAALEKEKKKIDIENAALKKENAELKKKTQTQEQAGKNDAKGKEVKLSITKDMNRSAIADLLVKNGVYSHKNDLMMIFEIININSRAYTLVLEDAGVMKYGGDFLWNLSSISQNSSTAADLLAKKGYVEDIDAFKKYIYLSSYTGGIKYGNKTFRENMSLREIADVLIN